MEAVDHLKDEVKEMRGKVTSLREDVHGYKVAARWVIGFCVGAGAVIGWAINVYLDYKKTTP